LRVSSSIIMWDQSTLLSPGGQAGFANSQTVL
jgi:hypothetical protein